MLDDAERYFNNFKIFLLQVLLTPPDEGPRVKGARIKLQDIIDGEYQPASINGCWISCEFHYNKI